MHDESCTYPFRPLEAIHLFRAPTCILIIPPSALLSHGWCSRLIPSLPALPQDAADKFGKGLPGIWKEYVDFEMQEGDVKRANAVRWRSQQL